MQQNVTIMHNFKNAEMGNASDFGNVANRECNQQECSKMYPNVGGNRMHPVLECHMMEEVRMQQNEDECVRAQTTRISGTNHNTPTSALAVAIGFKLTKKNGVPT